VDLLRDDGTFKRYSLMEGSQVFGSMPLKRMLVFLPFLFLYLCFLATMK
jgi:hypothetical protein